MAGDRERGREGEREGEAGMVYGGEGKETDLPVCLHVWSKVSVKWYMNHLDTEVAGCFLKGWMNGYWSHLSRRNNLSNVSA